MTGLSCAELFYLIGCEAQVASMGALPALARGPKRLLRRQRGELKHLSTRRKGNLICETPLVAASELGMG